MRKDSYFMFKNACNAWVAFISGLLLMALALVVIFNSPPMQLMANAFGIFFMGSCALMYLSGMEIVETWWDNQK